MQAEKQTQEGPLQVTLQTAVCINPNMDCIFQLELLSSDVHHPPPPPPPPFFLLPLYACGLNATFVKGGERKGAQANSGPLECTQTSTCTAPTIPNAHLVGYHDGHESWLPYSQARLDRNAISHT